MALLTASCKAFTSTIIFCRFSIGGSMPAQQKNTRPRMYGITPTPYEIPPELLPQSTRPKSKRPLPIALYGWYRIAWAGFSLILALIPWGDPESKLASYAAAHPAVIVDLRSLPV
jgi:hypothetical protein